jgi:hypothetical protein
MGCVQLSFFVYFYLPAYGISLELKHAGNNKTDTNSGILQYRVTSINSFLTQKYRVQENAYI